MTAEETFHVQQPDPFDRFDYFGRELSVDAEPGLVTDPGAAAAPACRIRIDTTAEELEEHDNGALHLLGPESAIDLAAWLVRWALPHLDKEPPPGLSVGPYMRAFNARDQLDLCQIACRRGDPS